MKLLMKRNCLLFVFIFSCLFASNTMSSATTSTKIRLSGSLMSPSRLRSAGEAIQTYQDGHLLQVDLSSNLGTINVYIYDTSGDIVYQYSVNTASEQQIFIDVTSLDNGVYTLEFINSQNQYLQGDFEI